MSLSADFVPDPNTERGAKYAKYADKYNFAFSKQYELSCIQCVTIARKQLGHSTTTLYNQDLDLPCTALHRFER